MLAGWFTYVYVQQKYCHLYLCKVVEYTEMTLDVCAMYFWGVPLSLIATASALWGYKLGYCWASFVPLTFLSSFALYVALLRQVIHHGSHRRHGVKNYVGMNT